MTDKFAAVSPETTAAEVLDYLRQNADILETVNEIYAVLHDGKRLGRKAFSSIRRASLPRRTTNTPVSL